MNFSEAAIGSQLEAIVRAIAPIAVAFYVAGLVTGHYARRLWRAYLRVRAAWCDWHDVRPEPAPAPPAPKPAVKVSVTRQPLTVDQLIAQHTQRQLMTMAGTKSKRSKKYLAEKILKNS